MELREFSDICEANDEEEVVDEVREVEEVEKVGKRKQKTKKTKKTKKGHPCPGMFGTVKAVGCRFDNFKKGFAEFQTKLSDAVASHDTKCMVRNLLLSTLNQGSLKFST